jgi:hypothetical protein
LTLLCLGIHPGPSLAGVAPDSDLVRVFYELEVTSYCGLTTDRVGAGFRSEVDRIMIARGIDDAGMQQARMQGWKEAHLEWQNRGLGGFRGWCRTEAAEAAARFKALAGEP